MDTAYCVLLFVYNFPFTLLLIFSNSPNSVGKVSVIPAGFKYKYSMEQSMGDFSLYHFQSIIGSIDFIQQFFIHSIALLAPGYKYPN